MHRKIFLLLPAGVIAVVALLAGINAFADFSSCTSWGFDKRGAVIPGNFTITVEQTTAGGIRTYKYSIGSPTGENPNKFFSWVRQGLQFEEGFTANRISTTGDPIPGDYLTPGGDAGGFPPEDAWTFTQHEDGVAWTAISIDHQFQFTARERFNPEESLTTILLGYKSSYEYCGPIYGVKNSAAPEFAGSPIEDLTAKIEFKNGCIFNVTAGATDNIVKSLEKHPDSPVFELYGCGGEGEPDCQRCDAIVVEPGICEEETNLEDCPEIELGRSPIFGTPGGTCYYPPNIKFPC